MLSFKCNRITLNHQRLSGTHHEKVNSFFCIAGLLSYLRQCVNNHHLPYQPSCKVSKLCTWTFWISLRCRATKWTYRLDLIVDTDGDSSDGDKGGELVVGKGGGLDVGKGGGPDVGKGGGADVGKDGASCCCNDWLAWTCKAENSMLVDVVTLFLCW